MNKSNNTDINLSEFSNLSRTEKHILKNIKRDLSVSHILAGVNSITNHRTRAMIIEFLLGMYDLPEMGKSYDVIFTGSNRDNIVPVQTELKVVGFDPTDQQVQLKGHIPRNVYLRCHKDNKDDIIGKINENKMQYDAASELIKGFSHSGISYSDQFEGRIDVYDTKEDSFTVSLSKFEDMQREYKKYSENH